MSENIDINVGIIKEEISINAANNIVEVNISTAPVTIINPQNYDLSQFTNTSPNPFIQQSTLSSYVPISRIITINGVAQDLSTNRSWTIPGATWGSITGTLAAQTDLQAALNARVPYTGATSNVNLGEYGLTTGQLTLDTSPTGTAAVGTTRWNDNIGSSETTLKGGSVILKNGVDLVARVVNKVTPNTTLTKANYPVVRVSGAQGQRLAIAYAQANNDNNSADTLGLVIETIATNQEGFIMTVGQLEGVNTTGSLQGETWVDGDVLYLSPTTPGRVTNIKPTGLTGHIVVIGYVEYAHAINGKIYVKIMNGWELDELHNVYINPATLANNNILQYDSADQLWKNKVLSTGITIGSTAIASGVIGRVLFEGTGNVVQESGNLFWDNTNGRLGVGTSSPQGATHIAVPTGTPALVLSDVGAPNTLPTLQFRRGPLSAFSLQIDFPSNNKARFQIGDAVTGYEFTGGNIGLTGGRSIEFAGITGQAVTAILGSVHTDNNNGQLLFSTRGSGTLAERARITNTGNVLINTTTDAGFRLDVNGTARVQGNAQFGTGFYWDNTNNRLGIGTSTPAHTFQVYRNTSAGYLASFNSGATLNTNASLTIRIENANLPSIQGLSAGAGGFNTFAINPLGGNVLIGTTTDAGFRLDVNGTARVVNTLSVNTGNVSGQGIQMGSDSNIGIFNNGGIMQLRQYSYSFELAGGGTNVFLRTDGNRIQTRAEYGMALGTYNVTTANPSAILEAYSTTKGFLPPRGTNAQMLAIASPATGLIFFDTTNNKLNCYDGTTWQPCW